MSKVPNFLDEMASSLNVSSTTEDHHQDSADIHELGGTLVEKISQLFNEKNNKVETNEASYYQESTLCGHTLGLLPQSKLEFSEESSFSMDVSDIIRRLDDKKTSVSSGISEDQINTNEENAFNDTLEEIDYILNQNSSEECNLIHINKNRLSNNAAKSTVKNGNLSPLPLCLNDSISTDCNNCETSSESIGLQPLSKIEEETNFEISTSQSSTNLSNSNSFVAAANSSGFAENVNNKSIKANVKSLSNENCREESTSTSDELKYMLSTDIESGTSGFLSQCTNISLPDDEEEDLLLERSRSPKSQLMICKPAKARNKFDNIYSPVACYIKQTPKGKNSNYNVGQKPIVNKTHTPVATHHFVKDDFKHVLSPVAVYIKSSPYSPLKQSVQNKPLEKENLLPSRPSPKVIVDRVEQLAVETKIYRPSAIKHIVKTENPKLPKGVCKLATPSSEIVKHQRIICNMEQLDKTLDGDLTAMTMRNTDISILTPKTYF